MIEAAVDSTQSIDKLTENETVSITDEISIIIDESVESTAEEIKAQHENENVCNFNHSETKFIKNNEVVTDQNAKEDNTKLKMPRIQLITDCKQNTMTTLNANAICVEFYNESTPKSPELSYPSPSASSVPSLPCQPAPDEDIYEEMVDELNASVAKYDNDDNDNEMFEIFSINITKTNKYCNKRCIIFFIIIPIDH